MKKEIAEKYREVLRRGNADEIAAFQKEFMPWRTHKKAETETSVSDFGTLTDWISLYEKLSAANVTVYGFYFNGYVYYCNIELKELKDVMYFDSESTSHGKYKKIRFRPMTAKKKTEFVNKHKCMILCSETEFKETKATCKGCNFGDIFEKMLCEKVYNVAYVKNCDGFYESPDIIYKEEKIQAKFENATLINENVLKNAIAIKGI